MGSLSEAEKLAELFRIYDEMGPVAPGAARGCCGGTSRDDADLRRHRHWLQEVTREAQDVYADDGGPAFCVFNGNKRDKICAFRWADPRDAAGPAAPTTQAAVGARHLHWSRNHYPIDWSKYRGAIVHAHGITESARTGLLRCRATEAVLGSTDDIWTTELTAEQQAALWAATDDGDGHYVVYDKSWAQRLVQAGFVVYAIEHSGHGFSQGWRGARCQIEHLEDLVTDFVDFVRALVLGGEVVQNKQRHVPVVISGLSMGGLVTARAVQSAFDDKRLATLHEPLPPNAALAVPRIHGWALICPAISGERLKKKFPNQVLLPLSRLLSVTVPHVHMVALEDRTPYPFIRAVIRRDPYIFSTKLPIRISAECVHGMDIVLPNADLVPADLSVFLLQSKYDTMTDPEGSKTFMSLLRTTNKTAHFLDYSWHWLAREPGYGATVGQLIRWLDTLC